MKVDFDDFAQPAWNEPDSVPSALEALARAHDESSADEAHDRFLWAVGDNQSGTFHPVALATLPELARILDSGSPWAQLAAIESLIDLAGTFVPDAGHETHLGAPVQPRLRAGVHALRRLVAPLASGTDRRATAAADLLELIDDQST